MTSRFRVLMVGAGGVFGSRLVESLLAEGLHDLVLAGREPGRLAAAAERLRIAWPQAALDLVRFDRETPDPALLRDMALVIDAAGPFQGCPLVLPAAAIAAGCHYLDLADARDFVARIRTLDAAARAADVAVLAGASSTPALSHAALDALTAGWRRIDRVEAAISPGNRAPRGLSVVRAILAYAGRPVRVFRDGAWTIAAGWGDTRRTVVPGLGRRWTSLCETPDLDLLAERYRPVISAEFRAGLELASLHLGLVAASLIVRKLGLGSLQRFARPARWLASLAQPFGTDRGGMTVTALGRDREGRACRATWSLVAEAGKGPHVPSLPAAVLARKLRDGELRFRGAAPSAGFLALADLDSAFARLKIATATEVERLPAQPLFREALGPAFDRLPATTRAIHAPEPILLLSGHADADGARSWPARLVARLIGFPTDVRAAPLRVIIERCGAVERWTRIYPTRRFVSVLSDADPATRNVVERFGLARFRLRVDADETGLALVPIRGWLGPVLLPLWALPRVAARESVGGDAAHRFDVEIALPLVGRLVRYRGELKTDDGSDVPRH